METPVSRVVDHQRQALDFMLDTLGLRHAHEEVQQRSRVEELEEAVAALSAENQALRTENRALRTEVRELERELRPHATGEFPPDRLLDRREDAPIAFEALDDEDTDGEDVGRALREEIEAEVAAFVALAMRLATNRPDTGRTKRL